MSRPRSRSPMAGGATGGKSNQTGSIRVLCCTGNLGNAKPDTDSLSAWIPNDGYCRYALHETPRYPLVMKNSIRSGQPLPPVTCAIPTIPESAAPPPPPPTSVQSGGNFSISSGSFNFSNESLSSLSPRVGSTRKNPNGRKKNLAPKRQQNVVQSSITPTSNNNRFSALDLLQEPDPPTVPDGKSSPIPPTTSVMSSNYGQRPNLNTASDSDSTLHPVPLLHEQFDIIVIGMQEATFDVVGLAENIDGGDEKFGGNDSNSNDLGGSFGKLAVAEQQDNIDDSERLAQSMEHVEHPDDLDEVADALANSIKTPNPAKLRKRAKTNTKKRVRSVSPKNSKKGAAVKQTTKKTETENVPTTLAQNGNIKIEADKDSDEGDHRPPYAPPKKTVSTPLAAGYKAGKATLKASQQAGKATYKVSQQAGKATYKASKQATKATLYVGKEAGKATIKVSKEATKVATVPIKATMKAGKAVTILATDKDHTDMPPCSVAALERSRADLTLPQEYTDTAMLHGLLESQLPSYTRAVSYQRGEMRLIVYYLESAINLDVVNVKAQNTGRAGLANKGGILAEVAVNKSTRLAFGTAHLEAHEGRSKYATRCSTIADILRCTEGRALGLAKVGASSVGNPIMARSCRSDASLANHFSFFMGDLNFRTRLEGLEPGSAEHVEAAHDIIASAMKVRTIDKPDDYSSVADAYAKLNQADELGHALRVKDCLVGFMTPYCNFPPTFKVHRHDGYRYNDKRSPSYTDRILYRASDQLHGAIQPLLYEPIDAFTTSDHKPLRGAFSVALNEKLKWRPVLAQRSDATRRLNRANLFRRGGMAAGKTDESSHLQPITQKFVHESLHLFISSVACQIDRDKLMAKRRTNEYSLEQVPCPYVCFISTPGDAIHKESFLMTKFKDRVRKAGVRATKKLKKKLWKKEEGIEMASSLAKKGTSIRMALEWPRTKKIKNTYRPVWGHDEEIYFKIRTHRQDGIPVDLSGSMLHLTLMDGRGGGEGKLIGTFTLNLAKLIEAARNPGSNEHKSTSALTWLSRSGPRQGKAGGFYHDDKGETDAMKAAQSSLRRILGHHNHAEPSEDSMKPPQPRLQQQISDGFTRMMAPLWNTRNAHQPSEVGEPPSLLDEADPRFQKNISTGRNDSAGSSSFATTGPSDRLREAMNTNVFGSRAAKGARRSLVLRQSLVEHDLQNSDQVIEVLPDGKESPTQAQQGRRHQESGGGVVDGKTYIAAGLVDSEDTVPKQPFSSSRLSNRRRSATSAHRRRSSVFGSLFHKNDASQSKLDYNHSADDPLENLKIISIKLDEPLLRNGKEVGRITCSIDAWWMEDSYDKGHNQHISKEVKKSRKKTKK